MNAFGQMFRPINYCPLAKAFHVARTAIVIQLRRVAFQKGIVGQLIENTQQPFALTFRRGSERAQDCIVHRVGVRWDHLPSAFNRSWSCSNSSREWPEPARELLSRRASSRCQSGSSFVVRHRMYSANSRRCSGSNSSTAFFNSATLMAKHSPSGTLFSSVDSGNAEKLWSDLKAGK